MAAWVTIETAAERYRVGVDKLLEYAQRGNLPLRRVGGSVFVDESTVGRFFRSRQAGVISYPEPTTGCLGVLGVTPLGGGALNGREGRRRALQSTMDSGTFQLTRRKATA